MNTDLDPRPDTDVPVDVWSAYDADPAPDETRTLDPVVASATDGPYRLDPEPPSRWFVVGAIGATLAVVAAFVVFAVGRGSERRAVDDVDPSAPASNPSVEAPPMPESPDVPDAVEPVPVRDDGAPIPTVSQPEPNEVPTVVPAAPSVGQPSPPPTPAPPEPVPHLQVQQSYELDPGVHGLTIGLDNDGDAPLDFELANVGDGYDTATPSGEIEPGGSVDVWLDLDVAPDGDGPTVFERSVAVTSNGGDATVTITGQVEKPGHLVADFASLPLVDYRATVSFTNVGGLPVSVDEIQAPGFTYGLLPDVVAAGETLELEVAICADDADQLPIFANIPIQGQLLPGYLFGGDFTIGTEHGSSTIGLVGQAPVFDPPTCQPVIVTPSLDLTFGG